MGWVGLNRLVNTVLQLPLVQDRTDELLKLKSLSEFLLQPIFLSVVFVLRTPYWESSKVKACWVVSSKVERRSRENSLYV